MKYDDNNDHGMPMELTIEAYEERMRDEEWADTVNDGYGPRAAWAAPRR
jgi:hypothetical protein